jgi:hypothetical protein
MRLMRHILNSKDVTHETHLAPLHHESLWQLALKDCPRLWVAKVLKVLSVLILGDFFFDMVFLFASKSSGRHYREHSHQNLTQS